MPSWKFRQDISLELNQKYVGKELKVLVDRVEGSNFVARSEFDSPEVDNEILIPKAEDYLRIGDFARVKIESADHYDLIGKAIS